MHLWIKEVACSSGNGGAHEGLAILVVSPVSLFALLPSGEFGNGPSMGMNCAYS